MEKKLELLAPARDMECALAAINFGADAVYIGANAYSARNKAGNSLEDIEKVTTFAHKFGAKVYAAVNTVLDDTEIIKAQKLVQELYNIGADAVIIQDLGLLELKLPPIKLFASTQCDIRTLEKVKFFENVGLSRVVLARELSICEISHICKNTNIEIETFIHGALCVSYSGQCYLSEALGGRSANRGECAQACRKKYTLANEHGKVLLKDKHLLNIKDFNATGHIDALVQAGVTSFKIEGRMKDVNYVKNVVAHYRKMLDKHPRSSFGETVFDFEPSVEKSFNRGFCEYFLNGEKDVQIHNFDSPKSYGEKLGRVADVGRNCFSVATSKKINPQDGLCMVVDGELIGCKVNTVEGQRVYPNKMPIVKKGATVFRNFDSEFEKTLANSKTQRRLRVSFKVFESSIEAEDEGKNKVAVDFDTRQRADNQEKMGQNFITQLKKSGESEFFTDDVQILTDALPFLPVSKINELRREIFVLLIEKRLKNYKPAMQKPVTPAKYPYNNDEYYKLNIHNSFAKTFMQKCGYSASSRPDYDKELMRCKHCIKRAIDKCGSKEKLYLIDDRGKRLKLEFDCKNCEMVVKEKI
ncbi:peptidase U32 [Candidatus Gastranaerophilus sp. (ex Termes propinquus)]|nr:peptidase U32 [Candidatus Gastranaerophilus sp. (ex Termes propinquus)]